MHARSEALGVWYWHAPGSGIWLQTGRTFVDTQAGRGERFYFWDLHGERAKALARHGYETVQFPVTAYNAHFPMRNNRFEIADLRDAALASPSLQGTTCASAPNGRLRQGWGAARACQCDHTQSVLTCK